jgi:ornithine cyclodeaminase
MTLLLARRDIEGLLDPETAMTVLETAMREEVAGTATHMPPYGGTTQELRTPRLVGGGLHGLGRWALRGGGIAVLFDVGSGNPNRPPRAIVGYGFGNLRVGATMGLAARYLARPDARTVGILGSGANALDILRFLCAVRPIERVELYSPTPEHRTAFAARATSFLEIPVVAHDTPEPVTRDVDIIAVATNSKTPVLTFDQLHPGVHVTSMGLTTELDESLYLRADQLVAASRVQEIESSAPGPNNPGNVEGGQLWRLLQEGRLAPESIVELGAIISGDVTPRNGPADITVFRESRGGVGDTALANWAYEEALRRGLGTEFDFE